MTELLAPTPFTVTGPLRRPRQMLADQSYGGHKSVHDEDTAAALGLAGAPIEGPTHFTQFEPLLAALWGERWFTHGCLSAHFLTMVVEGEEVRASVSAPGPGATSVRIDAVKADGTPVLTGTASVGPDHGETELSPRVAAALARPPAQLRILDQLHPGQRGARAETVTVGFDTHLGELYPFSLSAKLAAMTEHLSWHQPGAASPWGRPAVPIEMLSVITNAGSKNAGFRVREPSVGLFIDLEVKLLAGPVFVEHPYRIEREIVALGESRRTESYWTRATMVDAETGTPVAEVLLHNGVFKDSYEGYEKG